MINRENNWEATLLFLIKPGKVCLPLKLRKIGAGLRNAYGGGINKGENALRCVRREFLHESSAVVNSSDLTKVGVVDFHNITQDGGKFVVSVHVYTTSKWDGELKAGKEMGPPKWFKFGELPNNELMPADPYWLPPILAGKKIEAIVHYAENQTRLLRPVEIEYVDSFD